MSDSDVRYVEFTVRGLALDPQSNLPILLLQDHGQRVVLPIWIGVAEAGAIAAELEGHTLPRPMTHDLLRTTIEALDAQVVRVDVRALIEGTFYANLFLRNAAGDEVVVDCRPSDAIALAVRVRVPIRVAGPVLEAAQPMNIEEEDATAEGEEGTPMANADDEAGREKLLEALGQMDPEDFGKYKM